MPRKTVIAISLLAWFAPMLFLLAQMGRNGTTGFQRILFLPLLYGFTIAMWFRALLQQHWFAWTFAVLVSLGLPALLALLMVRASRWRPIILVAGLLLSCALTTAAYWLLRA